MYVDGIGCVRSERKRKRAKRKSENVDVGTIDKRSLFNGTMVATGNTN